MSINLDDSGLRAGFATLLATKNVPNPEELSRILVAEVRHHRQPGRRSWPCGPVPGDVMVVADVYGRCWERESGDPDNPNHGLWSYYRTSQHSKPAPGHLSKVATGQLVTEHGPITEVTAPALRARKDFARQAPPGHSLSGGLATI